MDGLNLKFAKSPLAGKFFFDSYGALCPDQDQLHMEKFAARISHQLSAETGLYRRLTDLYWRTDVEFTDNPAGNTPVLGYGLKRYGKRPLNLKFKDRIGNLKSASAAVSKDLAKRERKIVADQSEYMHLHESLKPSKEDTSEWVQWLVEGDQVMTGGGFDNNQIGDVQKSAMNFIIKGAEAPTFPETPFSQAVVAGSLWLRDRLVEAGLKLGSLSPVGCSAVRMDQDNDGLIAFPVYDHGWNELTKEVATRLLIESGVDTRPLVGARNVDPRTGEQTTTRVIQGIAKVLDEYVVNDPEDIASVVTLLARIQKHAWKVEMNGDIIPKKSKTRSVYPNSALIGMIEAMVGTPFSQELQRLKVPFMPSLQNKPDRVSMLKDLIRAGHAAGYEFLSLDESAYDATVIGGALATMLYYTVRPFFKAQYYDWVDMAIYSLVFKVIMCDTALCSINAEEFKTAKASKPWVEVKPFTIFGTVDGLISGAKLTHVGGSLYGGVVIHYVMPKIMGFEPFLGVQAGDDCVWAYPRERVDYSSMENTYSPVEEAAHAVGLDINKTKQIWHVVLHELVNIFLQDTYHEATDTWGVGSIFRPYDAVFFSERDKGLSLSEQLGAELARMNQGSDSVFAPAVVREWIQKEQFIGSLYKEYGVSAFRAITGGSDKVEEFIQRIDVGSFSFGVSREDIKSGNLPINPIIAAVASEMEFDVSAARVLKLLGEEEEALFQPDDADGLTDDPDIGDSDDVLAD